MTMLALFNAAFAVEVCPHTERQPCSIASLGGGWMCMMCGSLRGPENDFEWMQSPLIDKLRKAAEAACQAHDDEIDLDKEREPALLEELQDIARKAGR